MASEDFDTVTTIAADRPDIGIFISSTPTGARSKFWEACTDKSKGYVEHYHPSTHNPNWNDEMESYFRGQLSEEGYVHEILAEFGSEEAGVFNKDDLDLAQSYEYYYYNELDFFDKKRIKDEKLNPVNYIINELDRAPQNPFRTMGVDWDKFAASSSILILDYDMSYHKFRVVYRKSVPKAEYSLDKAVKMIIDLNKQYNPAWIYVDAGLAEYQIERLHIYGDEHPASGLKNKVVRWQFKQAIDILDPITGEMCKKPMKPFMVDQLTICFERHNMILSPFDKKLKKQLEDYKVERKNRLTNEPIFSSDEEHFVDALGLAYLAFVLKFSNLTNTIKEVQNSTEIKINNRFTNKMINKVFASVGSRGLDKEEQQIQELMELKKEEPDTPVYINKPIRSKSYKNNFSRSRLLHSSISRSNW